MATLVASIAPISLVSRGPGAIRSHAKRSVDAAHNAPQVIDASAKPTVARCCRNRPRGAPARSRQPGPWRASISASSALPACKRTLIQGSALRTGCSMRRVPTAIVRPHANTRNAKSASSRYARTKRSSKPPSSSSTSRRYAQSAVIQRAFSKPAERCAPNQSAGGRSATGRARALGCRPSPACSVRDLRRVCGARPVRRARRRRERRSRVPAIAASRDCAQPPVPRRPS